MVIEKLSKFRPFIAKIMPAVYDDSLTYYELLSKVVAYLNQLNDQANEIIDFMDENMNAQDADITELQAQFVTFKADMNTLYSTFTTNLTGVTLETIVETTLDEWYDQGKFTTLVETAVNNRFDAVNAEIDTKADTAYVDTQMATKAGVAYVDGQLALKATQTVVDNALATKANTADVTAGLAGKADTSYVDSEIASVETVLATKASTAYVDSKASTFGQLTDAPDSYVGQAGKTVIVNETETGLLFANPGGVSVVTENPANPYEGQMWLRDDLITSTPLLPGVIGVNNINVTNISINGYTVQVDTINVPTDPDNPEAVITVNIAEDSTDNVVALGVTVADINAGKNIIRSNVAGSVQNLYMQVVSSVSGAGQWSSVRTFNIPSASENIVRTTNGKLFYDAVDADLAPWGGTGGSIVGDKILLDGAGAIGENALANITPSNLPIYASCKRRGTVSTAEWRIYLGDYLYQNESTVRRIANGSTIILDQAKETNVPTTEFAETIRLQDGRMKVHRNGTQIMDGVDASPQTSQISMIDFYGGRYELDEVALCKGSKITMTGLPTGYKLRVGGASGMVTTESGGIATVDLVGKLFPLELNAGYTGTIEALDVSNNVVRTFNASNDIWGGDTYTY